MLKVRIRGMTLTAPAIGVGIVLATGYGCRPAASADAPTQVKAPPIVVPPGTSIPAVLLTTLESGVSEEGAEVPLLVSEDIRDSSGVLLIRKGTPAQGKITWSRREEMLGGITNRPARLRLRLLATVTVDGQPVDLCANPAKPEEPYELNRDNTGRPASARDLESTFADPRDQAVLRAMAELAEGGDVALLEAQDSRERLARISRELQMPGLTTLAQQNEVGRIRPMLDRLRRAGPINEVARHLESDQPVVSALLEFTEVTGLVSERMRGISHGRNIKAYVGTPIIARAR